MKRTPLQRKAPLQSKVLPRPSTFTKPRAPMRKSRPKSTPERRAARGMPCQLNVANVCNYNSETTVHVHFRWLGNCGKGIKPPDHQGCRGCSDCNAWTDSPTPQQVKACGGRIAYERDRNFYAARALVRMREIDRSKAA